ncbi:hypothetical protein C8F01DRAFT_1369529 [Mycena amicta]|nr:hypothetical protein C8F01DRAFT_1369529 [Mycena amicta]
MASLAPPSTLGTCAGEESRPDALAATRSAMELRVTREHGDGDGKGNIPLTSQVHGCVIAGWTYDLRPRRPHRPKQVTFCDLCTMKSVYSMCRFDKRDYDNSQFNVDRGFQVGREPGLHDPQRTFASSLRLGQPEFVSTRVYQKLNADLTTCDYLPVAGHNLILALVLHNLRDKIDAVICPGHPDMTLEHLTAFIKEGVALRLLRVLLLLHPMNMPRSFNLLGYALLPGIVATTLIPFTRDVLSQAPACRYGPGWSGGGRKTDAWVRLHDAVWIGSRLW